MRRLPLARAALFCAVAVWAEADAESLRAAKALFFDHKYAEARAAWLAILSSARGAQADTAAFWVARSTEHLGERERAFKEYGDFLARRPADQALAEEARTNRVGLAARLYKDGKRQYLPVLHEALADPSKTVRYYAALQSCGLGSEAGRPAVPLLKRIVATERDEDLVQRAKLCLLRLDPKALSDMPSSAASSPPPRSGSSGTRMLKIRIVEQGRRKVSVDVPMALAEIVFKSLPEDAKRELRLKGYDADNFWDQLTKLGPTQVIDIVGEEGKDERIQIWIE